jgi:hypothetical protein
MVDVDAFLLRAPVVNALTRWRPKTSGVLKRKYRKKQVFNKNAQKCESSRVLRAHSHKQPKQRAGS